MPSTTGKIINASGLSWLTQSSKKPALSPKMDLHSTHHSNSKTASSINSPPSSDADDERDTTSTLSRLNLDNDYASTSTTATSACHRRGLRARASTSPQRHLSSSSLTNRRRAETNTQSRSRRTPPRLDLASIAGRPLLQKPLSTVTEAQPDKPSDPIPIPPRKRHPALFSPTGTPLTARLPPGDYFNSGPDKKPHISQSLTPYYSSGTKKMSYDQSAPNVQRGFKPMPPRLGAPLYTPTSPLSPTSPNQTFSSSNRPKDRRPAQTLNLAGLPRFHPANFPSNDSSPASSSHRPSRSLASQPRPNRGSDAQQQLYQYQRDLVANAGKFIAKPSPPRLTPMRSPSEPMTPLMLEGQGDYLLAGSGSVSPSLNANEGREIVERMVQRENQRRSHPKARSGSLSPALSPASSPAVSPAGGHA